MKNREITLIFGFFVLFAGCSVKYTFENNSSFPVTVMPEYGNDFQIQSGTVKSFESPHKNMQLSYSPPNYVLVKKISSTRWEFTDDNYYLPEDRGFLIYPPENWQIMPLPDMQYKMLVGPNDNDFSPNITFLQMKSTFKLNTFVWWYLDKYVGRQKNISEQGYDYTVYSDHFDTLKTVGNLECAKYKIVKADIVQIYYFVIMDYETKMLITCSAPKDTEIDYEALFDSCVSTFELWG